MKKDAIINATRELFTHYGYKKVSMDEIAKEAGVTKKTIYSYFKNKEELLTYLILEEIEEMKKIVDKIENKHLSFFETIHETLYELLKYRKNAVFLVRIAKEAEEQKNELVTKGLETIDQSIQNYIKEKLEIAEKKNCIRKCNIDVTAFIIYKVYLALIYEWENENGKKINEKEASENISNILIKGLFYEEGEVGKQNEKR